MKKIAVIEQIHKDGLELLEKNSDYEYELITDVSEDNLIKKLPDFDGCTLRVSKLNENILKHCPKLKVISRHGVGYDNVDLSYIKKNNISLLITATANAVAVAEHVIYMMLSISKSNNQYDNEVRLGNFKKNASNIETIELFRKEMLIVGFGRIGKSLIKRCLGFDMKVNVFDPFVSTDIINEYGGNKVDNLDKSLQSCDYFSLHIPLTEKTKGMINYDKIKSMKKNAIIINTSRGGIINEIDLDKALKDNLIFGAGLDVFEKEPLPQDHKLRFLPNALLLPHIGYVTAENYSKFYLQMIENLESSLKNKPLRIIS